MSTATKSKAKKVDVGAVADPPQPAGTFHMLQISDLFPSPTNPRKTFPIEQLSELAESIKTNGVINPITVRHASAGYEVVSGGRRYRASVMAGLLEMPCIVRDLSDDQVLDIQIEENLHRQDVPPMEEAAAFQDLLDAKKLTVGELAGRINKSESYVLRRLKLTQLHELYVPFVVSGELPTTTAEVISVYPQDIQKKLFKVVTWQNGDKTVFQDTRNVKDKFRWEACTDLKKAMWPLDRSDLQPGLPACSACPKNSAVATLLFSDISDEPRCTDKACWKVKESVWKGIALQEWEDLCKRNGQPAMYYDLNYYKDNDQKIVEKILGYSPELLPWRDYDIVDEEEGVPDDAIHVLMVGASTWQNQEKNFTRAWVVKSTTKFQQQDQDWEMRKINELEIPEEEKQVLRDELTEKRRKQAEENARLRMEKQWRLNSVKKAHEIFTAGGTTNEALIELLRLYIRNSLGGYGLRSSWLELFARWAPDWKPTSFAIKVNGEGKDGAVNPKWTKGCVSAWQEVLEKKKRKGDYETMEEKAWNSLISTQDKSDFIDTILLDLTPDKVVSIFAHISLKDIFERMNSWNSEQYHLEYFANLCTTTGLDMQAMKPAIEVKEDDYEEGDYEDDDDFDNESDFDEESEEE